MGIEAAGQAYVWQELWSCLAGWWAEVRWECERAQTGRLASGQIERF
jgi:hypothetical protein